MGSLANYITNFFQDNPIYAWLFLIAFLAIIIFQSYRITVHSLRLKKLSKKGAELDAKIKDTLKAAQEQTKVLSNSASNLKFMQDILQELKNEQINDEK